MKYHKFQQIVVRLTQPNIGVRFSLETDKQYSTVRGLFISMKNDAAAFGTCIGMKVNNQEIFDDLHEIRLLTCGNQVAPNKKFFLFEEKIDAGGSTIEGKLTDGGTLNESFFPIDVKIYFWLTNQNIEEKLS